MTTINKLDINKVIAEWKNDATIDETKINTEICRTSQLHSTYLGYFIQFKGELTRAESAYYRMGNMKRKYYRGECTQPELAKMGWQQFQGLKPSATEMNSHLEFDTELVTLRENVNNLKTAVASMEYIIKSISSRDYSIKTLVDYNRYLNGN
jgi:hypothetical protein